MKKTTKLTFFGISFACCCAIIALLEVLNLHPEFSVGRCHSIWVGIRHMEFASGTMTIPASGREQMVQKDYSIGPIKIAIDF